MQSCKLPAGTQRSLCRAKALRPQAQQWRRCPSSRPAHRVRLTAPRASIESPATPQSTGAGAPLLVLEGEYTIRSSEVGEEGVVEAPALCNLMQELATDHVQKYGFAFGDLEAKESVAWVSNSCM